MFLLDAYCEGTVTRAETEIASQLVLGRKLVEDPELPISAHYYSALRASLKRKALSVFVTITTRRAKILGCLTLHRKTKAHDGRVPTPFVGAMIQRDAYHHPWSPLAQGKWTLIPFIGDFSPKLLFAVFFPQETTWSHVLGAQTLLQAHRIPLALLC
jgi:hypothetical protein